MSENDTAKLLKEVNAGVKMGVEAIDEVLDVVSDDKLKAMLVDNKEAHQTLGSETHKELEKLGEQGKEPSAMAKGMSWVKTNFKVSVEKSDATVADLITDGCNMGVKSLNRYLNKYKAADEKPKDIAKRLVRLEQKLAEDIREYL